MFLQVLEAEDDVDIVKLADLSQHGIPPDVRGVVWKYLLGVTNANKCKEIGRFVELVR